MNPTCFHPPLTCVGSSHLTLLLLTADSAAQHELHQLSQLGDVSHFPYEVHVWQVLIWHLVSEHLFIKNTGWDVGTRPWRTQTCWMGWGGAGFLLRHDSIPSCSSGFSLSCWPAETKSHFQEVVLKMTQRSTAVTTLQVHRYLEAPVVPALLLDSAEPCLVKPSGVSVLARAQENSTW